MKFKKIDFGIILALLITNAIIGFMEERKAESALDALRQTLALKSKVSFFLFILFIFVHVLSFIINLFLNKYCIFVMILLLFY